MYKAILLYFIGCLSFMPSAAIARDTAYVTGDTLHQSCISAPLSDRNLALGYVAGASDQIATMQELGNLPKLVCIPPNILMGQIKDLVCEKLAENPQDRPYTAASAIVTYLHEAFPCPAAQ